MKKRIKKPASKQLSFLTKKIISFAKKGLSERKIAKLLRLTKGQVNYWKNK